MDMDYAAVFERARRGRLPIQSCRSFQNNVNDIGRCANIGDGDDIAAFNSIGPDWNIRQINRGARSRLSDFQIAVVTLDGSHAGGEILRLDNDVLAALKLTTGQRPGHNSPNSVKGECAVDEQSWFSDIAWR